MQLTTNEMEYLKPEPRPKKKRRPIKAFSEKRARQEREMKAAYASIKQQHCGGCGRRSNLSRSHTIPRSKRPDLIADPRNIEILCMNGCHELCESSRFFMLENGEKMVNYMLEVDRSHAIGRLYKMRDLITEEELDIDLMPGWVGEILKIL